MGIKRFFVESNHPDGLSSNNDSLGVNYLTAGNSCRNSAGII